MEDFRTDSLILAGLKTDEDVAEALGWEWVRRPPGAPTYSEVDGSSTGPWQYLIPPEEPVREWRPYAHYMHKVPRFSTDILAALDAVRVLREHNFGFEITILPEHISCWLLELNDSNYFEGVWFAQAPTLPLAICRVILLEYLAR